MAKLVYAPICSVDGYIEDASGKFDWAAPDEETHQFLNDITRSVGTHLYGRRMYETMQAWENMPELIESSPIAKDFATVWQAAEKIVFSKTLKAPSTKRTRIERDFDANAIRDLKRTASKPLCIGGAALAAEAFRAGLVDEVHLMLAPVSVGGGKPALPRDFRVDLVPVEDRRFSGGMVYLRCDVKHR